MPKFEVGDVVRWSGRYEWRPHRKAHEGSLAAIKLHSGPFVITSCDGTTVKAAHVDTELPLKRAKLPGDDHLDRWYTGFFVKDHFLTAVKRAKEAQTYEAVNKSLT